jgi:hypothetical protein
MRFEFSKENKGEAMIKKFCDRCKNEITKGGTPVRLGRVSYYACEGCAGKFQALLDGGEIRRGEEPTRVGPDSIIWQGERWERLTETKAPPDDSELVKELEAVTASVPPHRVSQAIGAAPISLASGPAAPGDSSSWVPHLAQATTNLEAQTIERPMVGPPGAQVLAEDFSNVPPMSGPLVNDNRKPWQPGEVACEVHACMLAAVEGTKRCAEHAKP